MGVGVTFSGKKLYEGVRFNVISVMRGLYCCVLSHIDVTVVPTYHCVLVHTYVHISTMRVPPRPPMKILLGDNCIIPFVFEIWNS